MRAFFESLWEHMCDSYMAPYIRITVAIVIIIIGLVGYGIYNLIF